MIINFSKSASIKKAIITVDDMMKRMQVLSCWKHTVLAAVGLVCIHEVVSSCPFFCKELLQTGAVVSNGIHHREGHKYRHLVVHDVYDVDESFVRK